MPSQTRFPRPARPTLVTAGLALATLGGLGAGAAAVVDAGSSAPAPQTLPTATAPQATITSTAAPAPSAVPLARPAAATPARVASPAPAPRAVRRPKPARRLAHRSTQASRSTHRRAVRPRPPHRALRVGSRGPAVRWVQRRLGVRHTGHFAGHTRAAVRQFQRRHHVRANGVVARRTWVLLARTAHRHAAHHMAGHHKAGRHKAGRHKAAHRKAGHRPRRAHHAARTHHAALHRHGPVRHHARRQYGPVSTPQRINAVMRVARAQRGKPYVWGAAGPHAFDCSGYVQWVYRHAVGIHLPKYTDTQYRALRHIRARDLRRGDLVFVRAGRHESHVGIYAGHHRWWVAPHTGSHVKLQRIWRAHHVYARVLH